MGRICKRVFQVWDADVNEHIIPGTKIRVDAHILVSQQSVDGQHYLIAQLEYFGGTTGPDEVHFQNSERLLGPFIDRLQFSIRPLVGGVGAAIAKGYEQKAQGPEMTESNTSTSSKGISLPITFQGAGITPSYERIRGRDLGIKIDRAYEFDRVTSRDASECELQLSLTNCGDSVYHSDFGALYSMLKLPKNYGAGISISIADSLPTVRWALAKPIGPGEIIKFTINLGGTFSGVYKQSFVHVVHPYGSYHDSLAQFTEVLEVKLE